MSEYPCSLFPQEGYKERLVMDKLIKRNPGSLLLRQVEGRKEDYEDEDEKGNKCWSTRVISSGSMVNLSMNLLGAEFNRKCLPYRAKSERALQPWRKGSLPFLPDQSDYVKLMPFFFIAFQAKDLHNSFYPFPYTFQKISEFENMKNLQRSLVTDKDKLDKLVQQTFCKNNSSTLYVKRVLNHDPIMINYWHVVLDSQRPDNEAVIRTDEKLSNRDRKQLTALKQDLLTKIQETPSLYRIYRNSYKETMSLQNWIVDAYIFCCRLFQ
jgi:hypothetical protein